MMSPYLVRTLFYTGVWFSQFPSPAQDYQHTQIDLNKILVKDPANTCFLHIYMGTRWRARVFMTRMRSSLTALSHRRRGKSSSLLWMVSSLLNGQMLIGAAAVGCYRKTPSTLLSLLNPRRVTPSSASWVIVTINGESKEGFGQQLIAGLLDYGEE